MTDTHSGGTGGRPILVIGGGIAGITAALEAAEAGCGVILVEKLPYLGGRVVRSFKYFPKLCPPGCGLEINFARIKRSGALRVITQATVEAVSGTPGNYEARILVAPRYVTEACTMCGDCAEACPGDRADDYNLGMSRTKAAYLPHSLAFPAAYAIDRAACPSGCTACVAACKYGAVDLTQKPTIETVNVAAVVAATGWAPYDATKLDQLGFGTCQNVVTNVMIERLAAPDGPTAGKIVRPSDGQAPASVAFVQCAGSRDENHLPYCSAVCCAASLKQVTYLREQYPDAALTVFYIDIRTPGRLEDFYTAVAADPHVTFVKGKVAKVEEDPATRDLFITAEDALRGKKITARVNLLVLATGIVPETAGLPAGFTLDEDRFLTRANGRGGFVGAGCAVRPEDVSAAVQDATGAAMKALQAVVRSAHHG